MSDKVAEKLDKQVEPTVEVEVEAETEVQGAVPDAASDAQDAPAEAPAADDTEPVAESADADAEPADADTEGDVAFEDDDEYEDDTEDSLTYSNGVIEKIVAMATREVPHVLGMKGNLIHFFQEQLGAKDLTKGVSVEVTDDNRVIVNISVIIEYGCYAPAIFDDVKERVTERLKAMTGLEVAGINLRIEDVVTLEAYNESKRQAEANSQD